MCIAVFNWQPEHEQPLLLAGNRDEFFARPTAAMDWWPGGEILGGRDLQADGAWLGVTRSGRFALVTNIRNPALRKSGAPSRGGIVRGFLESATSAADYVQQLARDAARYEGFNLLCGHLGPARRELWFLDSTQAEPRPVAPGLHGLSNASLNTDWPKLRRARQGLQHALAERDPAAQDERLLRLLQNTTPTAERELPATGVPLEWERVLGRIFIRHDGYGTRASTVVRVSGRRVDAIELNHRQDETAESPRRFSFEIGS